MGQYLINLLPVAHCDIPNEQEISRDNLSLLSGKVAAHFKQQWAMPTVNGRQAMSLLFEHLQLRREDEVYITTTYDYPNVSSCVTCTVFNFCKPSRVLTDKTRVIFIIHEFGVIHPETEALIAYGKEHKIPVIEDCAHTIYSFSDKGVFCGTGADWVIVTLPKIFPVNYGGFLVGKQAIARQEISFNSQLLKDFNTAFNNWDKVEAFQQTRQKLAAQYAQEIDRTKATPLIESFENIMPWFFPVRVAETGRMLSHLRGNKIECGLWHGSDVLVLPLHQYLTADDIAFVIKALNAFT